MTTTESYSASAGESDAPRHGPTSSVRSDGSEGRAREASEYANNAMPRRDPEPQQQQQQLPVPSDAHAFVKLSLDGLPPYSHNGDQTASDSQREPQYSHTHTYTKVSDINVGSPYAKDAMTEHCEPEYVQHADKTRSRRMTVLYTLLFVLAFALVAAILVSSVSPPNHSGGETPAGSQPPSTSLQKNTIMDTLDLTIPKTLTLFTSTASHPTMLLFSNAWYQGSKSENEQDDFKNNKDGQRKTISFNATLDPIRGIAIFEGSAKSYQDCTLLLQQNNDFCIRQPAYDQESGKSLRGDCFTAFSKEQSKCIQAIDQKASLPYFFKVVSSGLKYYNANAVIRPVKNQSAAGIVTVVESNDGRDFMIAVQIKNLTPRQKYGIHIHMFGDISDQTGALRQGGHFNPTNKPHGCTVDGKEKRDDIHAGDLGSLTADENGVGVAFFNRKTAWGSLSLDSIYSIIGRGFVIHAKPDDCTSQPAGNSGARIAQGIFGWTNATLTPPPVPRLPTQPIRQTAISILTPTSVFPSTSPPYPFNGSLIFTQSTPSDPVDITLAITGLVPSSIHGLHIHAFGDLTNDAGMSLGGHFNPFSAPHGCLTQPKKNGNANPETPLSDRHAGDFGNIVADSNGEVRVRFESRGISLFRDGKGFMVGRGVSLHAVADDCVSMPTGNSGGRIAVGVIGWMNSTLL